MKQTNESSSQLKKVVKQAENNNQSQHGKEKKMVFK